MPDYGDDAIYVWSITVLGIVLPILMIGLSLLRVHLSKARLERLQRDEDQA
ncbi:MAG: hypothetical protein NXH72_04455 [Hyphomonadaceae bacterium]|nr:hypothetical protein [Hyphomonadaceae bacterium]